MSTDILIDSKYKNKGSDSKLILVSKEDFLKMFDVGILIGSDRGSKNWSITSKNKRAKGKNRYVADDAYYEYVAYQKRKEQTK